MYLKKAQLKRQPNQHAAVLTPGQNVQMIKVATLRDIPVAHREVDEFRARCIERAGCFKTPEAAEREISALEEKLLSEARSTITISSEDANQRSSRRKDAVPIWSRVASPAKGRG